MNHFTNLSAYHSRYIRYALIVLHIPLLAVCLAINMVGGVLTHSNTFVISILNAISAYPQNLMDHFVKGVVMVADDITTVAKGR